MQQTCFVECKASRSDFLRDQSEDGQMQLCLMERARNFKVRKRRPQLHQLRQAVGLGKLKSCLLQPMANIHYVLPPPGLVQKKDLPPRWGLLGLSETGGNLRGQ